MWFPAVPGVGMVGRVVRVQGNGSTIMRKLWRLWRFLPRPAKALASLRRRLQRKGNRLAALARRFLTIETLEPKRLLSTVTWANSPQHPDWNDAAAWVGGVVPAAANTVLFPTAATVVSPNLTGNVSVAGITIDNSSGADYSITQSGGTWTLTVGSGGILVATPTSTAADTTTISPNVGLSASAGFTATNNTGLTTLNLSGAVNLGGTLTTTGSGSINLDGPLSGSGGLNIYTATTLAAADTYTGATQFFSGTLNLAAANAVTSNALYVYGGTLNESVREGKR